MICSSSDIEILEKFQIDENQCYYNERLEFEINRRKAYSESRSKNRQKKDKKNISKTYDEHMENENENETININRTKKEKFQKPTVEEIKIYCSERKNNINPEQFFDFYQSKGWLVGKTPMKDWKAAVRTWEQKDKKQGDNYDPTDKYDGYRLPG